MSRAALLATCMLASCVASPALANETAPPVGCPGLAAEMLEQRFPVEVRRFAFGGPMLKPFLKLWSAGKRPHLPLPPEAVTVYVVPKRPYLVGFRRQGCMIAFLSVERQQLWQALRPEFGWPA